ncbi:hypothetical protein yc1106_04389 [Curvularia clavata]|uniref:DUF7730 domain-containing protein n=1 Tax=Curvularia clavata TaxID=95742 RepID=A0A9Q8Z7J6_CURCL|nr:hypothetical protein yc1106_04389 [Curvularia clavata]
MAPRKPHDMNDKATSPNKSTASTGAGVVKRRYEKVRFYEDGLLNIERKAGKYFKMARQNQQQSPLLRLPAELRNKIFAYALGGRTFRFKTTGNYPWYIKNVTKYKHALALLQVCRQIYAETALLPFSTNTFSASRLYVLEEWAESLHSARAQSIKWIRLKLQLSSGMGFLINKIHCESFKFDKPLVLPEISNRGHVVLSLTHKAGIPKAVEQRMQKKIMRMFKEKNEGINFVFE